MIKIEDVVAAYVARRNKISELTKEVDALKEKQANCEAWLTQEMQKQNVQNMKFAGIGTVYQTVKESVTVGDWDAALNWVKENAAWEFLTAGFKKAAVLDSMGEKREGLLPPGINYQATRTVGIRKG